MLKKSMRLLSNIGKAISHPFKAVKVLFDFFLRKVARFIKSDETFIKLKWWATMDYPLHLDNPKSFNEKLQWLKLHDRKPVYTRMVDKADAKNYVRNIIGEDHIIPTLAIYDKIEDLAVDRLPKQFVLKCTHDSAGIVICKNKAKLDIEKAKKKLSAGLARNYFIYNREWPYKDVKPRIIAEKFMSDDEDSGDLKDYKFFCFNGKVKFFKIDFNRFNGHRANYYDINGNLLPYGEVICPPNQDHAVDVPNNINEMVNFAEKLSSGVPFLRVDFYSIHNIIYFGELTFYPASGFGQFLNKEQDFEIGEMLKIN